MSIFDKRLNRIINFIAMKYPLFLILPFPVFFFGQDKTAFRLFGSEGKKFDSEK